MSLPFAMVAPLVDPDALPSIRPDAVPAIEIESPAFDRPLRIGVLLDGLTTTRWVAKILQDIMAAPFLTLSLVIVDATDPAPPRSRGAHGSRGSAPPPRTGSGNGMRRPTTGVSARRAPTRSNRST